MKIRASRKLIAVTAFVILSSSMVVYAATTLFTQTFPAQTFATPTLVPNSACVAGALVLDTTDSTNPTYSGGPSALVYGCDASGASAFTVQGTSKFLISVTVTVTGLPTGWTLLIVNSPSQCTTSLSAGITSSGTYAAQLFTGGTSWLYCLYSQNAASFSSFSIAYSQ